MHRLLVAQGLCASYRSHRRPTTEVDNVLRSIESLIADEDRAGSIRQAWYLNDEDSPPVRLRRLWFQTLYPQQTRGLSLG